MANLVLFNFYCLGLVPFLVFASDASGNSRSFAPGRVLLGKGMAVWFGLKCVKERLDLKEHVPPMCAQIKGQLMHRYDSC
jgi:hypothetical protein